MKKNFHQASTKHKKAFTRAIKSSTNFLINSNITHRTIGIISLLFFVTGCNKPEDVNNPPEIISITVSPVNQNTKVGDVIGTINAKDLDNDQLSYQLLQGSNLFTLDGNKIKARVSFGQELLHKQHPITVMVSDGELTDEKSATVEEIGGNGTPETVQYPDIEVERSINSGTYTFNPTFLRDGVPTVTKTELADNDPNTATYQYDIVNGQNGVNRTNRAKVVEAIAKTGLGDATALGVASFIASGGYGIAGMRETTTEERKANNQSFLVNEHGEFVSGPGFKRVIQFFKEKFNLTNANDFGKPPFGDRNLQNARACAVMLGIFVTQTGADDAETVYGWGADAAQMVTSMTDDELTSFMQNFASASYFDANGGWHKKI